MKIGHFRLLSLGIKKKMGRSPRVGRFIRGRGKRTVATKDKPHSDRVDLGDGVTVFVRPGEVLTEAERVELKKFILAMGQTKKEGRS